MKLYSILYSFFFKINFILTVLGIFLFFNLIQYFISILLFNNIEFSEFNIVISFLNTLWMSCWIYSDRIRNKKKDKKENNYEMFIDNVCLSYRHDFGLLSKDEQDLLRFEADGWYNAINKNKDIL